MCIMLKVEETFTSFHHGFWGPRISISLCPGGLFTRCIEAGVMHGVLQWNLAVLGWLHWFLWDCRNGLRELGGTICVQVSDVYLLRISGYQRRPRDLARCQPAFRPICSLTKTTHGSETMRNLTFLCLWNDNSLCFWFFQVTIWLFEAFCAEHMLYAMHKVKWPSDAFLCGRCTWGAQVSGMSECLGKSVAYLCLSVIVYVYLW